MNEQTYPLDYSHPNFEDAQRIYGILEGCRVLRRGVSSHEVIHQLLEILRKREVVITEVHEDKEMLSLERGKLALRHAEHNLVRERLKIKREQIEKDREWTKVFVGMAKKMLDCVEFMALRDMADEEFNRINPIDSAAASPAGDTP